MCWTFTYHRSAGSATNITIPSGGSRYYIFGPSVARTVYIGNSVGYAMLDYKAESNNVTY